MRAVILLNPTFNPEHAIEGRKYAEASVGFDYNGAVDDQKALAKHLRSLAMLLESDMITVETNL